MRHFHFRSSLLLPRARIWIAQPDCLCGQQTAVSRMVTVASWKTSESEKPYRTTARDERADITGSCRQLSEAPVAEPENRALVLVRLGLERQKADWTGPTSSSGV